MREVIEDVLRWAGEGLPVAVATVVSTKGSVPRSVGAKMALAPNYRIAGSVSGGCVEGALYESGLSVLNSGRPQLLRFGISEARAFETVGLACGGEIAVWVERLDDQRRAFWERAYRAEHSAVVLSVVEGAPEWQGAWLAYDMDAATLEAHGLPQAEIPNLQAHALTALRQGEPRLFSTQVEGRSLRVFADVLLPRPTLVIVGATHIAIALTSLAHVLGFRVVVVDPRGAFNNAERFPHADERIVEHPQRAFTKLRMHRATAVAVLSHNERFDDPALIAALQSEAFYVGALGSQRTQAQRRARLLASGLSEEALNRLHGPIGLRIGARTPEEIALAVMAEIIATQRVVPPAAAC
ncbi:MAG: XdhC family protein [Thermoflexales bacterium]